MVRLLALLFMVKSRSARDIPEKPKKLSGATIIVLSLPLSGHHVLNEGLLALEIKTSHNEVNRYASKLCATWPIPSVHVGGHGTANVTWPQLNENHLGCYVGQVIQLAVGQGVPPLKPLIDLGYRAFTQLDVCRGDGCFFPQVEAIAEITAAYPHAYYIHTRRSSLAEHAAALSVWQREGDNLLGRYEQAGYLRRYPGQSEQKSVLDNAQMMLTEQTRIILDFFKARPRLRFLEVNIVDPGAGVTLQTFLNLTAPVPLDMPDEYYVSSLPKPEAPVGAKKDALGARDKDAAKGATKNDKSKTKAAKGYESVESSAATDSPRSPTPNRNSKPSKASPPAPLQLDATDANERRGDDDHSTDENTPNVPDEIIILVGLPKSGTTSIQDGLRAMHINSAHFEINKYRDKPFCTTWPVPEVRLGGIATPKVVWKAVYKVRWDP